MQPRDVSVGDETSSPVATSFLHFVDGDCKIDDERLSRFHLVSIFGANASGGTSSCGACCHGEEMFRWHPDSLG